MVTDPREVLRCSAGIVCEPSSQGIAGCAV